MQDALVQWFCQPGPWTLHVPKNLQRDLRGQHYFYNNTKTFYTFFTVLTFALKVQNQGR